MIVYSVNISIDSEISDEWLSWMKAAHIPDVLRTGCFVRHELLRRTGEVGAAQAHFVIRYYCESEAVLNRYQTEFAPQLQAEHRARYEGRFQALRELFQVLDESGR